jgi:uncharacterized protein YndB with AHSA1/START domain
MANPLKMLPLQTGGIQFIQEVPIEASPKKVWAALSDVGKWFGFDPDHSKWAKSTLEMKGGGKWIYESPDGSSSLFATVSHIEPGKLLRLTGQMGMSHLPVVNAIIFELQERAGGKSTLLRMCQRTFGFILEDTEQRTSEGWKVLLPNLKALAEK